MMYRATSPLRLLAFCIGLAFVSLIPVSLHADHQTTPDEYLQFQEGLRCFHERDYAGALECWIPLAETGVAEAQYNIGRMYAYGEGVEKDYTEAFAWFVLSARNGRLEARTAMDQLKPHMTPEQITRAYERADEMQLLAEPPGS